MKVSPCSQGGRRWVGCFLALMAFSTSLPPAPGLPWFSEARADDDRTARAREAFVAAIKLEEAGSFEEALKKFREVAAVKTTPQVLFHIGLCQEKLNQWVDALASYNSASKLAEQSSDPKIADVKITIDNAIRALDAKVPTLALKRGKGARNASISVDGRKVEDPKIPLRLMPGKHVIQARAKGRDNFREEVNLREGQKALIEVTLDLLDDGSEAEADPKDSSPPPAPATSGRSVAPFVVIGVGGLSLAASGVFFLLRNSAEDDLKKECIGTICPSSARATGDRAATMNTLTNVAVGVGAAGVAVGLVWALASGPSSAEKSSRLRLSPAVSQHQLGAGLSGSF